MLKKASWLFAIAGSMLLTGCTTRYNVEVYASEKLKDQMEVYPSLEIDIVGVNANEAERFESCSIDDYFIPGNALRTSTDHVTLTFSEDSITPKLIRKNNDIWKKFDHKGAEKLYLLVNLPQTGSESKSKDTRRITIPLEYSLFSSDNRYFEITPAGINILNSRPEIKKAEPADDDEGVM